MNITHHKWKSHIWKFCYISQQQLSSYSHSLMYWGCVTHLRSSKLTIIYSDNGLSSSRCQAIIWSNAGIWLIGALGANCGEILYKIHTFSFKKWWKLCHICRVLSWRHREYPYRHFLALTGMMATKSKSSNKHLISNLIGDVIIRSSHRERTSISWIYAPNIADTARKITYIALLRQDSPSRFGVI